SSELSGCCENAGDLQAITSQREGEQLVVARPKGTESAVARTPIQGISDDCRGCDDRASRNKRPKNLTGRAVECEHGRLRLTGVLLSLHRAGKYDAARNACRSKRHAALCCWPASPLSATYGIPGPEQCRLIPASSWRRSESSCTLPQDLAKVSSLS